jgi:hypothetical protein
MSTRAISPFIAFCHIKRDEVKAANPTAGFGDMGRLLAVIWKEMSQSERMVYTEPAAQLTATNAQKAFAHQLSQAAAAVSAPQVI